MRLVFAGTPDVALPSLEAIAASGHELMAVVTRPDAARGRSGRLMPSPVAAWAAERGIEVLRPLKASDPDFLARLVELAPDACPVVAYGALLPQAALDIPALGWVNLHFSLLPRWRGAAPAQRTIIAGDAVAGATTFRIVSALDAGPIYRTLRQPLDGTETSADLLASLAVSGARLLAETVDALPEAVPVPQDAAGLTLAPKLTVDEARVDWTRDGNELERLIRGCWPSPVAWTTLSGERIKVGYARNLDTDELDPGEIRVLKRSVHVGTGTNDLELVRVQPPGRKEMAAADWGRGLRTDTPRFDPAQASD